MFSRRLKEDVVRKAALVIGVNMLLFITGAMVIFAVQPELGFSDVIFEVISGISTVGMTTGITRSLGTVSRVVIIVLMYCGRIGSLSFALSFSENNIGIDIDYNMFSNNVIGVIANGTSVVIRKT